MKHQNSIPTAYDRTLIKHFGVVTNRCQYSHDRWYDTTFCLVDTEGRDSQAGLPGLIQLHLAMLNCAVQAEENNGFQIDDLL